MTPLCDAAATGSFLDSVPGLDAAWVLLGILEGVVSVAVVASLLNREFLPTRRKPLLLVSVALSMLTFAFLLFAQTMVAQFDSVAQLFAYFTGSAVILVVILLMPPYRRSNWLSGLLERWAIKGLAADC